MRLSLRARRTPATTKKGRTIVSMQNPCSGRRIDGMSAVTPCHTLLKEEARPKGQAREMNPPGDLGLLHSLRLCRASFVRANMLNLETYERLAEPTYSQLSSCRNVCDDEQCVQIDVRPADAESPCGVTVRTVWPFTTMILAIFKHEACCSNFMHRPIMRQFAYFQVTTSNVLYLHIVSHVSAHAHLVPHRCVLSMGQGFAVDFVIAGSVIGPRVCSRWLAYCTVASHVQC